MASCGGGGGGGEQKGFAAGVKEGGCGSGGWGLEGMGRGRVQVQVQVQGASSKAVLHRAPSSHLRIDELLQSHFDRVDPLPLASLKA